MGLLAAIWDQVGTTFPGERLPVSRTVGIVLWAKVLIPVVMVGVGSGAAVAAVVADDGGPAGAAAVWIDGPSGTRALAPGTIPVTAHATADATVTGLDLYVDGEKVAEDRDLERTEKLFIGEMAWPAEVGLHELEVRQVGGAGETSAVRRVLVAEGAMAAEEMATTTTPPAIGDTTTVSTAPGDTTPSTTPPDDSTTTAPVVTDPGATPSTEAPPEGEGTVPPDTQPPDDTGDDVEIASATLSGGGKVYVPACGYSVQVQARVANADYAQVMVVGTGFNETMERTADSSFSLAIPSGVWSSGDVGTHEVVVVAGGGGASDERSAGTIEVIAICPKD